MSKYQSKKENKKESKKLCLFSFKKWIARIKLS